MSSKVCQFRSLQIHHIRHNRAKFQMLEECFPNQFHQPNSISWQDPRDPKRSKNQAPQLISFFTMEKQMIHRLPITTTHNAPVNKIKASKPQVITREDPIPCGCPNKERDTLGRLNLPNAFLRKNSRRRTK